MYYHLVYIKVIVCAVVRFLSLSLSLLNQVNSPRGSAQKRKRPGGGGEEGESDGEKSEGEGELVVDDPSPAGSSSSYDRQVNTCYAALRVELGVYMLALAKYLHFVRTEVGTLSKHFESLSHSESQKS